MNTKLTCLLLDDELPGLTYLRMLCGQIPGIEVLRAFNDPLKFLQETEKTEFDFCIIDIEMPQMSGLDVAKILKDKPVIFTTAYKEYAAEAFDLNAVDYVRKPIEKERLQKAIEKVAERIAKTSTKEYIQVNTNKGKALLYFRQIIHITNSETDKRDKGVTLETGEQLVLKNISFDQLLSELPAAGFCRINKKDIISLKAIKLYTHNQVIINVLNRETTLLLSDNFKKEFISKTSK